MKEIFVVISHGLDHPDCEKEVVAICTEESKAEEIRGDNPYLMIKKAPLNQRFSIGEIIKK